MSDPITTPEGAREHIGNALMMLQVCGARVGEHVHSPKMVYTVEQIDAIAARLTRAMEQL